MSHTRETEILLDAIQEAGSSIVKLQEHPIETTYKSNNDPLTAADLLANDILKKYLIGSFPHDGWLSEETVDDHARLTSQRIWIVDPIDGTKEFVKKIPEYSISVALVENGTPILSAVFNPMTRELFHAVKNQGAWLNGKPIHCDCRYDGKLKILASRTEMADGVWSHFMKDSEVKAVGSIAYKLALVAAGMAHSTFSLGPKSEWDIAAGVLLVQEAGGIVTDKSYRPFVFNQKNIRVNGIIACTKGTYPIIHDLIQLATREAI